MSYQLNEYFIMFIVIHTVLKFWFTPLI